MSRGKDIKAVIFDLGNVLVDFDHTIAAKKIARLSNKKEEEIFELFFDSDIIGKFEEGAFSPDKFFREVSSLLGLEISFKEFLPIWNEIFFLSPKNRFVYASAVKLKNRYKLLLLSNINILHYDYLKANFPVFDVFDNIVTSFDAGSRKPDSRIYQKALDIIGSPAESVFYTDDRLDLIDKSLELGINGFQFQSEEKLVNDLLSVGIDLNTAVNPPLNSSR